MVTGIGALLLCCGVLAGGSLLSSAASAQQFSADLVRVDARGAPVGVSGKIYVADGKVRIETPEVPTGYFVIDSDRAVVSFVQPARRVFMDAQQSSRLTQLFVPVDPATPCRQWRAAAELAGITAELICTALAPTGDGERALEGFAVTAAGDRDERWIDAALRFPVKIKTSDGAVVELRNIETAQQPAHLFEIPAGYRRFDPRLLIERIKQSDVWVEPPGHHDDRANPAR